ncbi:MAG: tetratricopeptide repeat protein [Firmicutes bacterium]|nr:tetratricopeptide repeat protein [Bacillota bacterium]
MKYKIAVYAICKNEEKFVDRWVTSMNEADAIFVLDTGSTDNTVEKLKSLNVNVTQEQITPWRFDVARNKSLELVPEDYDICVCTDLDEVFESGWRQKLEEIWNEHITRLGYNYNWQLDKNNKPIVNFCIEKIHSRNNYKWTHPVHEILEYVGPEKEIKTYSNDITVNHYPDTKKSRSSYLPLLELSVKENPNDDRNVHYLGREYMYYQRWNESIDTLIKHLNLPSATWRDERCASMRFIARCYQRLNRPEEARMWLDKAIIEAPHLRDPYMEKALLEYSNNNWRSCKYLCLQALEIKAHPKTYINEVFSWDYTVYDLLSICYYYENNIDEALFYINKALEMAPKNTRLLKNKQIIENFKKLPK